MAISGHLTRSVFDRYNIVSAADLRDVARKMNAPVPADLGPVWVPVAPLPTPGLCTNDGGIVFSNFSPARMARNSERRGSVILRPVIPSSSSSAPQKKNRSVSTGIRRHRGQRSPQYLPLR
jgi:hypothetical protein